MATSTPSPSDHANQSIDSLSNDIASTDDGILRLKVLCNALIQDLTHGMKQRLPALLRGYLGVGWENKLAAKFDGRNPFDDHVDFQKALEILSRMSLLPKKYSNLPKRCREFHTMLVGRKILTQKELDRGRGQLRLLASELGINPRLFTLFQSVSNKSGDAPGAVSSDSSGLQTEVPPSLSGMSISSSQPAATSSEPLQPHAAGESLEQPVQPSSLVIHNPTKDVELDSAWDAILNSVVDLTVSSNTASSINLQPAGLRPAGLQSTATHDYPTSAIQCLQLGDLLFSDGRFIEAAEAFTQALSLERTTTLYLKRSAACAKLREWELARQDAEDALELDPLSAEAYIALGDALLALGKEEEALAIFRRARAALPIHATIELRVHSIIAQQTERRGNSDQEIRNLLYIENPEIRRMYLYGAKTLHSVEEFNTWHSRLKLANSFIQAGNKLRRERKIKEALAKYERAIEMDNAEAMYKSAVLLLPDKDSVYNNAVFKNPKRGVELLRRAVAQPPSIIFQDTYYRTVGVSEAENRLGCIYRENGDDVTARMWFLSGAQHGDGNAQCNMGVFFLKGIGGPADVQQAVVWFQEAVSLNVPEAKLHLARLMISANECTTDHIEQARSLLRSAANSKINEATKVLAQLEESGMVVTSSGLEFSSQRAAAERLRMVVANSTADSKPEALMRYASALLKVKPLLPADAAAAENALREAAALGHIPASLELARLQRREKEAQFDVRKGPARRWSV